MQQRTAEDATVPQFLEETVEVVVASVERVQQKFIEHNFVLPMPKILKHVDEVARVVPQQRLQQQIDEQSVELFLPQIVEENVDVMSLVAQERLQPTTVRCAICTCASSSGVYGEFVERTAIVPHEWMSEGLGEEVIDALAPQIAEEMHISVDHAAQRELARFDEREHGMQSQVDHALQLQRHRRRLPPVELRHLKEDLANCMCGPQDMRDALLTKRRRKAE